MGYEYRDWRWLEGDVMLPYLRRMLGRARVVTPGSASYSPGTFSFVVPEYNTLTIDLKGAGGGGASMYTNAASGTPTQISALGLVANGGGGAYTSGSRTYAGAAGGASGGDTNITGGGGAGGDPGGSPVGIYYNPGGAGGRLIKTYTYGASGAPVPGTSLTISVGAGGAGAGSGGAGGSGSANLSWS